jgi:DNA-directed RNA polymerase subunit N
MIIPVRCFSCGKPSAQHWQDFSDRVAKGEKKKLVLDSIGLERFCCRTMFMGHVELIDVAAKFKKF